MRSTLGGAIVAAAALASTVPVGRMGVAIGAQPALEFERLGAALEGTLRVSLKSSGARDDVLGGTSLVLGCGRWDLQANGETAASGPAAPRGKAGKKFVLGADPAGRQALENALAGLLGELTGEPAATIRVRTERVKGRIGLRAAKGSATPESAKVKLAVRFSATVAGGAARKGTFALKGRGATGPADPSPLPVIAGSDVERVAPLATIALDGSQSAACTGTIAAYAWTVEGPPGTAPVLTPGASAAAVQCVPTVVGDYTFRLSVRDSEGRESAEPAALRVEVRPDTRLHVELTWRTPLDPDETDEGPETGSDVDLHFAHEQAGGEPDLDGDGAPDPWFDTTFDCFWFNRSPAWDPGGKANPVLDRDDFDGGGPEIVSVAEPETGGTYRIAVHYWSDHDYGEAFATLRVYVDGALAYEEADVRLTNRALWFVGTVSWPSGAVTPVRDSGQRRITPDYQNPDFFQP